MIGVNVCIYHVSNRSISNLPDRFTQGLTNRNVPASINHRYCVVAYDETYIRNIPMIIFIKILMRTLMNKNSLCNFFDR